MASLFDTLQAGAYRNQIVPRSKQSMNWFRKKVDELGNVSRTKVLNDPVLKKKQNPDVGDMVMYVYDPKFKKTLPYYDTFPLTIMVQPAPGGFHGLNLHYLSPVVRANFLDELMGLAPKKMTETTRIRALKYDLLKKATKFKEFKPCFKHYLTSHIESRISRVPMADWEIAIFLPTEQFKKKGKQAVWTESAKIARRS